MATLHEEAECLRVALVMGLVDSAVIVDWAYRIIERPGQPPVAVLELATSTRLGQLDIASLLAKVEGEGDLAKGARMALALLHERVKTGMVDGETACGMLYVFSHWAHLPETERQQANSFEDVLYCAKQGYYGTMAGLGKDVVNFLGSYAHLESEIPLPWTDDRAYS